MNRVRRFDIFAMVNYLKNRASMSDEKAKGEAIWLSKLVANRKLYGGGGGRKAKADTPVKNKKTGEVQMWKSLSGIPQTDAEYNKAIVDRFGEEKYAEILESVKTALEAGYDYKAIRDCDHATGGRNTGWCASCSENFAENFSKKLHLEMLKAS